MKKPQYNESRKQTMMQYAREHLKRIPLSVQKPEYERIKAAAAAAGESINGYIKTAVRARMDSENIPESIPEPDQLDLDNTPS